MTIRHLKIFICVCKHQSMTKAAEELFIAQPAVSNTIAEIEKNYNIKLLYMKLKKTLSGKFKKKKGSVFHSLINSYFNFSKFPPKDTDFQPSSSSLYGS